MTGPPPEHDSESASPDTDKHIALNLGPMVGTDGTISSTSPADPSLDAPAPLGTAVALALQAERLANEIRGLRVTADSLAKRIRRNGWVVALTAIGLILDIALSIFGFILLTNQETSNARLETFAHGRCAVYSFIIPSYREATRSVSPLGPIGYDDAYRRMQVDADSLNCGIPHRI